ncbi:MAG: hypothetical protein ACRYHQ_08605 [Janthinobacterium lividum]
MDDLLTLDITVEFTIHAWMTDDRYLGQEITTWSVGEGRSATPGSVATNQRSLVSEQLTQASGRLHPTSRTNRCQA